MIRVFGPRLAQIVLIFAVVEIVLAIVAIQAFGFGPCFLWWLISCVLALSLMRSQAMSMPELMLSLAQGGSLWQVVRACRRLIAALLFLLPGFLSDALALLLLLVPLPQPRPMASPADEPGVFEGEFRRVEDPVTPLNHERTGK